MSRLIHLLRVIGLTVLAALALGSVINTIPGIIPILFFGFCWWAQPLPELDLDAELRALLEAS